MWYDLKDFQDPALDALARQFNLHPLHIEDCRSGKQRAKVEDGAEYLFVVLKPIHVDAQGELSITDFDVFLSHDFIITVQHMECPAVRSALDQVHGTCEGQRPDQVFYRAFDSVVDAYLPALDWFSEEIDALEDIVLEKPSPETLQRIFSAKRGLIELRRVLGNMRDVAGHIQRSETKLIHAEMWPFVRDLYDHLARNLDMVEVQRDLLTGALDIYLSSVANRTNQVMKVLTILGTVALPSVVVSGFFGMNTKGLPWIDSPHGTWIALGLMTACTVALLIFLKKYDWL